jgi:hypothetical protein
MMKLTTKEGHAVEGTPQEIAEFLRIQEDAKKDRPQPPAPKKWSSLSSYLKEIEERAWRVPNCSR